MATGRRYYWIKLSVDFMTGDVVDYLMSRKDGASYIMLYEQMCLMSVNSGGRLSARINGREVPYDAARIQREAKYFPLPVVRSALAILREVGLIDVDAAGVISIVDYAAMTGSSTDYADQKRGQRRGQSCGQCPPAQDGHCADNPEDASVDNGVDSAVDNRADSAVDTSVDIGVDNVHTELRAKSLELRDTDQDPYSSCSSSCAHARERPDADTLEAYASGCLRSMTEHSLEQLNSYRGDLPDELIRHAIDEACASGTPTWSYARAILNRYVDSGYRTVGDAEAAKAAWTRQRQASAPGPRSGAAAGYQQRAHTEADFAGLYIDIDAPDAGSGP